MQHRDRQYIDCIKKGDRKSFELLFKKYYRAQVLYAYKYVEDMDTAQNIVQECWIKIWNKREVIDITQSVKGYLFQAVRFASIDYLRKEKSHQFVSLESINSDSLDESCKDPLEKEVDLNCRLDKALRNLPNQPKKVFLLAKVDKLSYKEIALELNISVKTVEMHMGRALRSLREELRGISIHLLSFFLNRIIRRKEIL